MKRKYVFISLVTLLLGLMIAMQYKIVQKDYLGGMVAGIKLDELKTELYTLREEKDLLTKQLNDMQKQIDEFVSDEVDDNVLIRSLSDELIKYKMFSGYTNLQGQGVSIYLSNDPNNSENTDLDIVADYNLILFLINELNAAGSEAISINDQRYVVGTEIRGNTESVIVNGVSLKPPFIIKAIGDKNVLSTAIEQRFGVVEVIRKRGYFCQVNKLNDLRIVRSNKILEWKYATPPSENGL